MELIGRVLGNRYEILEKIGEGGMATVYKARCNLLNRFVAIKILKKEYANDDTFVNRFRVEAQSAAALTHPNIVSVYDVGQEVDKMTGEIINYIVMELLENKTLKDYIEKHGALSSEETLKISAQVVSALEAAHRAHIIHRDIKPQNIILNRNMVAKVTDFGIAKITNTTSSTITSFGSTMGSVHYFSPEHAKGGYTDEKSDIYSLGVVMYEMATGKIPFDADTPVSVALKHIQEEPVYPIIVNPRVTAPLNQIILKAMAKNTSDRYKSASEMLIDISKALSSPNSIIPTAPSSVEAGATQVIPTIEIDEDYKVPNLRTREPSSIEVNNSRSSNKDEKNNSEKENEKSAEEKAVNRKNQKKKKRIVIISIIVIILILALIISFASIKIYNKIQSDTNTSSDEIEVPDLVGKPFEDMVNEYSEKGIKIVQKKLEYNSEQAEGYIISQTPEANEKTKNKEISVVVSRGTRMATVSNVVGKDIKVVKYELEDTLGFKVEVEEVINDKVNAGLVISQSPTGNSSVEYGSTVKLTVSKGDGKATVLMPNALGKKEADAKSMLEEKGLTVSVKYSEDSTKQNGVVISQNYPENQELKEGDLVQITVNKLQLSKTVSLDLLELQGGSPLENMEEITVKVTASIDGGAYNSVFDKTFETTDTKASFTLNGYTSAALKIYLNGTLVKEQNVDF